MKKLKIRELDKKQKILISCIVVVVIASMVLLITRISTEVAENITTVEASTMNIENTLTSEGEISSSLEEDVLPHTSYYLEEINVKEGEAVEEDGIILTYTNGSTMKAPYNCVVESWNLPEEDEQLTSEHYITIAGTDVMKMKLSVAEDQIAEVSVGDSATITIEATNQTYEGDVSYVSQVGTYSDGSSTFEAELTFDNDGKVMLGMNGTAEIKLESAENVVAVPVNAVSTKNGKTYVTLVDGNKTTQQEVETGISNDSYIEIKSGLEEGNKVQVVVSNDDSSNQQFGPGGDMNGGGMNGGGMGAPPNDNGEMRGQKMNGK